MEELLAILDVELLNGSQLNGWGMEASDNLEWPLGVDLKLDACTVSIGLTHLVSVDVATITFS